MSQKKGIPGGVPYPMQPAGAYPTAPPAYSAQAAPLQAGAQGGAWNEPPPPYTAAPGYPPQMGYSPQQGAYPPQQGGYPQQQGCYPQPQGGYPQQQGGYPPQQGGYSVQLGYPSHQGGFPPQGGFQPQPGMVAMGPGTQVHVKGAFSAGARFDARTQPSIPPPPPGVAPNMAQLAAMSGATVVASQRKNDKWVGGAGGGAVFW